MSGAARDQGRARKVLFSRFCALEEAARGGIRAFIAFFWLWKGTPQARHQNSAFSGRGPGGSGGVPRGGF